MEFSTHRQPPEMWVPFLDEWVHEMRYRGLSEETCSHYWYIVSQFARDTKIFPKEVTTENLVDWLLKRGTNESRRSGYNAFSTFYKFLSHSGRCKNNPVESLPAIKRQTKMQPAADRVDIERGILSETPRNRRIIRCASEMGLRRAEIPLIYIPRDVVDDEEGKSLIVHGKGAKDRLVPMPDDLAREFLQGGVGWAFPGGQKGHLCADTVYDVIKTATGWSPHALRRRFAADLYVATNGDLRSLQILLGHESLATTQRYVPVPPSVLRQAVQKMRYYRQQSSRGIQGILQFDSFV
jgi:integrase/recombinase XerD